MEKYGVAVRLYLELLQPNSVILIVGTRLAVTDPAITILGGITNGLDMTAAYIRQRFPGPLADTVCALADVRDRGTQYETGKVREVAWWIWLIHRSWFRSLFWRS